MPEPQEFEALLARVQAWTDAVQAEGWLEPAARQRLDAIERAAPDDLFRDKPERPFVVALFGGTGVGKSTLLNRIAGQTLARTGVERPTSHEVTLFVHEGVALADLPRELPLDAVHVQRHASAALAGVAWLDMPDIDSVEERNRQTALAWLPFVDLVCYVVSPERYRDDAGWRVLQARGARHGWLFVMNRWDEGDARQADDFARMLREAGFERPTLLRTSCRAAGNAVLPSPDEFDRLIAAIEALVRGSAWRELAHAAERARVRELRTVIHAALARLGNDAAWRSLGGALAQRWAEAARTISGGLEYSLLAGATRFSERDASIVERLVGAVAAARSSPDGAVVVPRAAKPLIAPTLWDAWAQSKLEACVDSVEVEARRGGLGADAIRAALDGAARGAGERVGARVDDALRATLSRPGTALTRCARRVTGFLTGFLPFMATLWIGYAVVVGYYAAVHQGRAFLGTAFAINSALLLAVAWGVPFAIDRWLKPSTRAAAERGLRAGLADGLEAVRAALRAALDDINSAAAARRAAGAALAADCEVRLAARGSEATADLVSQGEPRVAATAA